MGRGQAEPPVILIDAAHGLSTKGALALGLVEADVALETAIQLGRLLTGLRCEPVMTRTMNEDISHKARQIMALQSDLVVSIHYHSDRSPLVNHVETWSKESNRKATELARLIGHKVSDSVGKRFQWKHTHKIQLVCGPKPGVVVVAGYMSDPDTAERIKAGTYQLDAASGIYDALVSWYSL